MAFLELVGELALWNAVLALLLSTALLDDVRAHLTGRADPSSEPRQLGEFSRYASHQS